MEKNVAVLCSSLICTLACRTSSGKVGSGQSSLLGGHLSPQGRVLFDLVLTLAPGAGTWFDLTSGRYYILVQPSRPEASIEVGRSSGPAVPSPYSAGAFVQLEKQTRLTIRNAAPGGEPEPVAIRIMRAPA
jgi:hypothetical protein